MGWPLFLVGVCECVSARVRMCARKRVCERACVRACVCVCMYVCVGICGGVGRFVFAGTTQAYLTICQSGHWYQDQGFVFQA